MSVSLTCERYTHDMTNTTVTDQAPADEHIVAGVPFLPGRTVELTVHPHGERGIVVDVTTDGQTCTVKFGEGALRLDDFRDVPAFHLRAVTPDLPVLAHDTFIASALGEQLAKRNGVDSLAGFHRGHNDGRIAYTESARDLLREVDLRIFAAKHQRCHFTYVETADGVRRAERAEYQEGDRLVGCLFYVDGPSSTYCGAHLPGVANGTDRPSIFHAGITPAETDAARGRGELVDRAPIVRPGAEAEAPRVFTEQEVREREIARICDAVRAVCILDGATNAADRETPGLPGRALRELVERRSGVADAPLDMSLYWEALAYGQRRGLLTMHTGPAWSAAPDYAAHAAEVKA